MRGTWHGLLLGGSVVAGVVALAACSGGEKTPAAGTESTAAAPASAAASGPSSLVYVSDERGNKVTVINGATDSVVKTIDAGQRPRGVRLTPDGKTLVVAVSGSPIGGPGVDESKLPPPDRSKDGIALVDLATDSVRRLQGGHDPENFDITPDGKFIYVSNEDAGTATVLDMSDGKAVATVKVGSEPEGVKITPDGKEAWVTSEGKGTVTVINVASKKPVATITVGKRPRSVIFAPDGSKGYVPAEVGGNVSVVDVKTHKVLKTLDLTKTTPGAKPMGSAISPDGKFVYITTGRGATLEVIATASDSVVATIPDPKRPWGVAVTSDGSKIYTANGPSNDVAIIDAATNKVVKTVPAGDSPWGVAISHQVRQAPGGGRFGGMRSIDRSPALLARACPTRSTAAAARLFVAIVHAHAHELLAGEGASRGMPAAHVGEVALVVGRADDGAHGLCGGGEPCA